jgi:uncharacterized damage-inducible protein DinB
VTYYGAKNLAESFRTVRKNTLIIANEIPEEQYGFRAAAGTMSVAEMFAHLAIGPMWHLEVHGNRMTKIEAAYFGEQLQKAKTAEQALASKADITRALTDNGEQFARFVEGLDEATLAQSVELPMGAKSRFELLLGSKEHEMHHRGQLMLIQRMLGQVPELTRRRQAMQSQRAAASSQQSAVRS